MIDTNQINLVAADAAAVKQQVQMNWTAIAFAAALVARELRNFNQWSLGVAEFVIKHGGLGELIRKLLWNPSAITAADIDVHADIATREPEQLSAITPEKKEKS